MSIVGEAKLTKPMSWNREKNNLEQYRALMALDSAKDIEAGTGGGQMVAKKVATQIRENGFLGALAFASEKKKDKDGVLKFKNPGHQSVFEAIRKYLVGISAIKGAVDSTDMMMESVAKCSAAELRYIMSESIDYMNYLRRFAKPDKKDGKDS